MRGVLPTTALALLALGVYACRDGGDPFQPRDRPPLADSVGLRLTFSPGDDRLPAWSTDGDSVYYTSESYAPLPGARGVILSIPRRSQGPARPLLRNVQPAPGALTWITAPAVAANGRIAFVEIGPLQEPLCDGVYVCPLAEAEHWSTPPLDRARVHTRALGSTAGLGEDTAWPIEFEGAELIADPDVPRNAYMLSTYHPFQTEFIRYHAITFRPGWAPDGERLVLSDGLRLLISRPDLADPQPVPGTDDGVMPAWSPDGEWIAFTWLQRTDSADVMCDIGEQTPTGFETRCNERRVLYSYQPRIVIIRPDGSGRTVLAVGRNPAWAPDSRTLFYAAADGIRRLPLAGGSPTVVPHTRGGREPAVSPDGRLLAFARRVRGQHDIHVVELE